jgi:hypothetical protein
MEYIQNQYYLNRLTERPTNLIVAPETAITIPENELAPILNHS